MLILTQNPEHINRKTSKSSYRRIEIRIKNSIVIKSKKFKPENKFQRCARMLKNMRSKKYERIDNVFLHLHGFLFLKSYSTEIHNDRSFLGFLLGIFSIILSSILAGL